MPTSDILELPQITEAQSQKATAFNIAMEMMAAAVADTYVLDTSDAVSNSYDLTLPYDDSDDLSERTALRFIYLDIAAGATESFEIIHPASKHFFYAKNNTDQTCNVRTELSVDPVVIGAGASQIIYCDGDDCIPLLAGSTTVKSHEDFAVNYFNGPPQASEVVAKFLVARDTTFAADFSGAVGDKTGSLSADMEFDVRNTASSIGTITLVNGGGVTFETNGNTEITVTAGSTITVVAPATYDAGLTSFQVVLPGTVVVPQ